MTIQLNSALGTKNLRGERHRHDDGERHRTDRAIAHCIELLRGGGLPIVQGHPRAQLGRVTRQLVADFEQLLIQFVGQALVVRISAAKLCGE